MSAETEDRERAEFEKHYGYVGWQRDDCVGLGYLNQIANLRWETWQAACREERTKWEEIARRVAIWSEGWPADPEDISEVLAIINEVLSQ